MYHIDVFVRHTFIHKKKNQIEMKYLLSLPSNAADSFHTINNKSRENWFCTSDPKDKRLGSGGGTVWLLEQCYQSDNSNGGFEDWLQNEKRVLIHAGGQSRRLPSYAIMGKTSLPVPVFRWARGQKLSQNLLSLQKPLFDNIMEKAPEGLRTLIASGDVYIRSEEALPEIPDADVVCLGLWGDSSLATRHGVFANKRKSPETLDLVMQKPSLKELEELSKTHFFLMDIGLWLLSDKAVNILRQRSYNSNKELSFYDLYSDFGLALGENPKYIDKDINNLSVKVVPLTGGEFYHFGTTKEMISSTLSLQNKVYDQRLIMHRKIKPNNTVFTQNSDVNISFSEHNNNIWIENSYISNQWSISSGNVITGVPKNNWVIHLRDGICIDIVPLSEGYFAVRPYGINDSFSGDINNYSTNWMGQPISQWFAERGLRIEDTQIHKEDIQRSQIFPVVKSTEDMEKVLKWMTGQNINDTEGELIWLESQRVSAEELMDIASLKLLHKQRSTLRKMNCKTIENNYERSVFYQLDLADLAQYYSHMELTPPDILPDSADELRKIHNRMFRSRIFSLVGNSEKAQEEEEASFAMLRQGMIEALINNKREPKLDAYADQIVWGRSPVRIDLAGGWTDTPPYSLYTGGNVVNIAIELNSQPPLQAYVRPIKEYKIVLRSIDMGDSETIETFEELRDYNKVGSAFSIPKAALALCGFLPEFSPSKHNSLKSQLQSFGSGIEITLLAAIPTGSGLGTSSILASTVLGALNDFCGLQWKKQDLSTYTLILEQLLTTGGGWQDQYGGIFHGVKLLQSDRGFIQKPQISWLPDYLFTDPMYKPCHLLYYTGITRVAKNILSEIVRGMFLNSSQHLHILEEMKTHAIEMSQCIQRGNFEDYGKLVLKTWQQKKQIDKGTNPPEVEKIIDMIKDYALGYELPGAGGGGYLYIVAKSPEAAARIKKTLLDNSPNSKARFVDIALSDKGFQVTRS